MLYLLGMLMLAGAQGTFGVTVGAGLFMGVAMSCTASALANSVASRAVPAHVRSIVLGGVTAVGSLGAMLAAPFGQGLAEAFGWRAGVIGFVILGLGMIPAAWFASKVDAIAAAGHRLARDRQCDGQAGAALRRVGTCRSW